MISMVYKRRVNKTETKSFGQFIREVRTDDIGIFFCSLDSRGKRRLSRCLKNSEELMAEDKDGYTVGDTIASYAPWEVVKELLDNAKADEAIKMAINKT